MALYVTSDDDSGLVGRVVSSQSRVSLRRTPLSTVGNNPNRSYWEVASLAEGISPRYETVLASLFED
jgi:hypothetical protein